MKVYKMIVDKRPAHCLFLPFKMFGCKIDIPECGQMVTEDIGNGWKQGSMRPDHRCIFRGKITRYLLF